MNQFTVCIPTLIRHDLLRRTLIGIVNQSVHPKTVYVVDNNGQLILDREWPFPVVVVKTDYNWGTCKSWNTIARISRPLPVVFSNDDIEFKTRTALDELVNDDREVVFGAGWGLFRFNEIAFTKIGEFDENFWPCSAEDIDAAIRLRLYGCAAVAKDLAVNRSGTGKVLDISEFSKRNRDYAIAKWGSSVQDVDDYKFTFPFNNQVHDPLAWLVSHRAKHVGTDELQKALHELLENKPVVVFNGPRTWETEILLHFKRNGTQVIYL